MQLSAICTGWMILFAALPSAGAVEPAKQDEQAVAQELKETRQLVEKLSAQVKKLERRLETAQVQKKSPLRTVAYKVADLVDSPKSGAGNDRNFDHLIHYIMTRVAPEHWESKGGPGTMAPYRANLSLVISATPEVHEEVSDRLAKLREAMKIREAMKMLEDFHGTKPQVSVAY